MRSSWNRGSFIAVTVIGIVAATVFHLLLDPSLRSKLPEDYPADLKHWLALVLFSLAFNQLFLLFAPFAWLMRLFQNRWVATILTVLFGAFVLVIRIQALPTPLPPPLLAALLAGRIVTGFLAVWFYLRGGVLLIWWWTLSVRSPAFAGFGRAIRESGATRLQNFMFNRAGFD